MTKQSICFAGLSREEEAAMVTCFKQVNASMGNRWQLATETEAAVLVIDMESMYGQMSLMKALGTDKILVALTAGSRADTDYLLSRPVTEEAISALLSQIGTAADAAAATEAQAGIEAPPAESGADWLDWPAESDSTPASGTAPSPAPEPVDPVPEATNPPAPAETAAAPPPEPRLVDYLRAGALAGPVRLQAIGAPDLVLDPASRTYLGASPLKPLLAYCNVVLPESDLVPVDASELPAIAGTLGGSQPWSRLSWLCALTSGNGNLADGFGSNDRYRLLKWPQTEREFPKHFRIATVMMKGPALLTDIAEHSGASLAEVIDFVNASLATGAAEPHQPAASAAEAGKGSLLGRFRR